MKRHLTLPVTKGHTVDVITDYIFTTEDHGLLMKFLENPDALVAHENAMSIPLPDGECAYMTLPPDGITKKDHAMLMEYLEVLRRHTEK